MELVCKNILILCQYLIVHVVLYLLGHETTILLKLALLFTLSIQDDVPLLLLAINLYNKAVPPTESQHLQCTSPLPLEPRLIYKTVQCGLIEDALQRPFEGHL